MQGATNNKNKREFFIFRPIGPGGGDGGGGGKAKQRRHRSASRKCWKQGALITRIHLFIRSLVDEPPPVHDGSIVLDAELPAEHDLAGVQQGGRLVAPATPPQPARRARANGARSGQQREGGRGGRRKENCEDTFPVEVKVSGLNETRPQHAT